MQHIEITRDIAQKVNHVLGDAVLNLAIGHLLMEKNPDLREGDLSRMRANLVNESQLAQVARKIDLSAHIQLGKGEIQSAGQGKESILANALRIYSCPSGSGYGAAGLRITARRRPMKHGSIREVPLLLRGRSPVRRF